MITRRKRPKNGDVFAVKLDDKTYGYGQLVEGSMLGCYIFYDIIAEEHPPIEQIAGSSIILLTFTVDQRIVVGDWKVIGNAPIPENVTIPEFKMDYFENGSLICMVMRFDGTILRPANKEEKRFLRTMKSYTPNLIEDVLKAKFGLTSWDSCYDELLYKK